MPLGHHERRLMATQPKIINKETDEYRQARSLVSLGKLFSLLDMEPTPMQQNIIRDYDERIEDWSEMNLIASRRSGKTATASVVAVYELLIPNSSVILVSKSSKSLTNNFNNILLFLRKLGVRPDKLNSNTYSLSIGNSHLRCSVHKQTENLLGSRAGGTLILDEAGVYPYKEFMERNLSPMRLDYGSYEKTNQFVSKILRVSSPRTIGSDFHKDAERGLPPIMERHKHERNDGYISPQGIITYNYNIYDSPLVTPTIIEAIKKSTDEDVWKTEYLGQFIHASATNVFPQFNKQRHLYDKEQFLDKMESVSKGVKYQGFMGIDIGLIDSSAFVVGTIIDNKLYILETFMSNLMTTTEVAKKVLELQDKWGNHQQLQLSFEDGATYLDPSAASTRFDLANEHEIENLPAFNRIKQGINDINTLMRDNLIQIPTDAEELILQIETLAYKEAATHSLQSETSGDPFVRIKGHHFDMAHSFRYLVASLTRFWGLPIQNHMDYESLDEE